MQGAYSQKNSSLKDEDFLSSARSAYRELSQCGDQRQQDLQLLIRAHERIRQIEEEVLQLKQENGQLINKCKAENIKSQKLATQNLKLQQINGQLLTRILQLEKKFNDQSLEQSICKELYKVKENIENTQRQSNSQHQNLQHVLNIELSKQQGTKLNSKQKVLKQSESTPVILNINVNPFSKEERQSFLKSCKQTFAEELCKIKVSEDPKRSLTRNNSEYFGISSTSNNVSQLRLSKKNFLKEAQQEFSDQNSKTLKNIYLADRKKSTSSTSGSLIRKSFLGQRQNQQGERKIFAERTNIWNSKYASIDQILNCPKNSTFNNSQSGLKLYASPSEHVSYTGHVQRQNINTKNGNKSIYFKSQLSKSLYGGKGKPDDIVREKKKKEIQLELRNQQTNGFIKYRGLCL